MDRATLSACCRCYLPVFTAVLLLSVLSFAMALCLVIGAFFRDVPPLEVRYWSGVTVVAFIGCLTTFNGLVLSGHSAGAWGMATLLVLCLLVSLPTLEYRPNRLAYAVGVFSPLIGLYLLTGAHYRAMRRWLTARRHQRRPVCNDVSS